MTIADNIRKLRELFNVTQEELGDVAGVSSNAVSQWENGRAMPRMGAIERIAACYQISKSNIIEDGGMDVIDPVTKKPKPMRPRLSGEKKVQATDVTYIPLRGRVHAGAWTEPDVLDEVNVCVPQWLYERDKDIYAVEVEGDCMSRVYPEGCIVIVSPNSQPQNGSVAVVSIDYGDAMMRRLYRTAQTLVLSPDSYSDCYDDIVITSEDDHVIEFGGKVVWFQSNGVME